MLLVGAVGGTLVIIGLAQKMGWDLNEEIITIVLEMSKYGLILWLMKVFWEVFL